MHVQSLRKIFYCLGIFLFHPLFACDFCTLYTGVLPQDRLNRFEYYQRYSYFKQNNILSLPGTAPVAQGKLAHIAPGSGENNLLSQPVKEQYVFHDFRYTFFAGPAWQISAGVPVQKFREIQGESTRVRSGLGETTVWALYGLVRRDTTRTALRWFAGGGFKLPTGWHYRTSRQYEEHFFEQGGTGTPGMLGISSLNFRRRNWGISQLTTWRYSLPNANTYRAGSVLNLSLHTFVIVNVKYPDVRWVPAWAVYIEQAGGNRKEGYQLINTGGMSLLSGPDFTFFMNRWAIRTGCLFPLYEKFNGEQPKNSFRFQMGLMFTFGKNAC